MLAEELEDLAPAIHRLLLAVRRAVVVEEAVARAIVPMELVVLALLLQLFLVLVTCSGEGPWSSLPNRPRIGQDRFFVSSIGATGRLA